MIAHIVNETNFDLQAFVFSFDDLYQIQIVDFQTLVRDEIVNDVSQVCKIGKEYGFEIPQLTLQCSAFTGKFFFEDQSLPISTN